MNQIPTTALPLAGLEFVTKADKDKRRVSCKCGMEMAYVTGVWVPVHHSKCPVNENGRHKAAGYR